MTNEEKKVEKKAAEKPAKKKAEKKDAKAEPKKEEKPVHAEKKAEEKHEHAHEHAHPHPAPEAKAEAKPEAHAKPAEAPAAAHAAPAAEKKPKKARKKSKAAVARGKRKESIARATVVPGKGRFVFNRVPFDVLPNRYIREIVKEPLNFLGAELATMDIKVNVRGGGQMGQAQAARTAIAKALVEFTGNEQLKNTYLEHDRSLLVEDVRRVEPKKYKGPKARARFQKSYR